MDEDRTLESPPELKPEVDFSGLSTVEKLQETTEKIVRATENLPRIVELFSALSERIQKEREELSSQIEETRGLIEKRREELMGMIRERDDRMDWQEERIARAEKKSQDLGQGLEDLEKRVSRIEELVRQHQEKLEILEKIDRKIHNLTTTLEQVKDMITLVGTGEARSTETAVEEKEEPSPGGETTPYEHETQSEEDSHNPPPPEEQAPVEENQEVGSEPIEISPLPKVEIPSLPDEVIDKIRGVLREDKEEETAKEPASHEPAPSQIEEQTSESTNIEEMIQEAERAIQNGDYQKARKLYLELRKAVEDGLVRDEHTYQSIKTIYETLRTVAQVLPEEKARV